MNANDKQVYWTGRGYNKPYKVPGPLWRRALAWLLWNIGNAMNWLENLKFNEERD